MCHCDRLEKKTRTLITVHVIIVAARRGCKPCDRQCSGVSACVLAWCCSGRAEPSTRRWSSTGGGARPRQTSRSISRGNAPQRPFRRGFSKGGGHLPRHASRTISRISTLTRTRSWSRINIFPREEGVSRSLEEGKVGYLLSQNDRSLRMIEERLTAVVLDQRIFDLFCRNQ